MGVGFVEVRFDQGWILWEGVCGCGVLGSEV